MNNGTFNTLFLHLGQLNFGCPKFFLLIRTDKAVEYFSYKESCVKLDKYININLVRIK